MILNNSLHEQNQDTLCVYKCSLYIKLGGYSMYNKVCKVVVQYAKDVKEKWLQDVSLFAPCIFICNDNIKAREIITSGI